MDTEQSPSVSGTSDSAPAVLTLNERKKAFARSLRLATLCHYESPNGLYAHGDPSVNEKLNLLCQMQGVISAKLKKMILEVLEQCDEDEVDEAIERIFLECGFGSEYVLSATCITTLRGPYRYFLETAQVRKAALLLIAVARRCVPWQFTFLPQAS